MSSDYYVYELIDPRTKRPFYVGKGRGDRCDRHLTEAKRSPDKWVNRKKCEYIRGLWDRGLEVIVEKVAEELTERQALDLELKLIEQYGRLRNGTGILTNVMAVGSESGSCGTPVVAYTVTGAIVKSFTSLTEAASYYDIHKSTICAALNKRTFSAKGLRWFHVDEPFTYLPNPRGTRVDQYDPSGNFIATFMLAKDAGQAVGISPSQIFDCCAGRLSSAGGFQWAFYGEKPIREVTVRTMNTIINRELVAYSKNGDLYGVYSSIKEAVEQTPANPTGISDCCAGRKKTSGGLRWEWRQKEGA